MIILGTKSKRRIDLFSQFSLPFEVVGSDFDEDSVPEDIPIDEYVRRIASGKASLLSKIYPDQIIITADTTVYFDKKIYNKPKDFNEAVETLSLFQGKRHEVWTGVCVKLGSQTFSGESVTSVFFYPLTKQQIEAYLHSFDFHDRAGSYSIQDGGGLLVQKIEGDFYNVIGFPVALVQKLLLEVGIDLWSHLRPFSTLC